MEKHVHRSCRWLWHFVEVSFRQAEDIPRIENCRIQLIGTGVKDDWKPFLDKAGKDSGMFARIIPVLACDRTTVRLF